MTAIVPDRKDHMHHNCERVKIITGADWQQGQFFTGGDVWVKVTMSDPEGKVIGKGCTKRGECNRVLGINPDFEVIKSYCKNISSGKETLALIMKEADYPRADIKAVVQFNEFGWPNYGPPNGFGLCQADEPGAEEKHLWNWKNMIEYGRSIFLEKYNKALDNTRPVADLCTEEQILIDAFQRYNGGVYILVNARKHRVTFVSAPYGKEAYKIYKGL